MKRLPWLMLIAILSFNLIGITPGNLPTITNIFTTGNSLDLSNPFAIGLPIPGYNVVCKTVGIAKICASVSNKTPTQYTYVTVYGSLKVNGVAQVGKTMKAVWHYKTTTPMCSGLTNANGTARCKRYISSATKGYRVLIYVTIGKYTVATSFTPK